MSLHVVASVSMIAGCLQVLRAKGQRTQLRLGLHGLQLRRRNTERWSIVSQRIRRRECEQQLMAVRIQSVVRGVRERRAWHAARMEEGRLLCSRALRFYERADLRICHELGERAALFLGTCDPALTESLAVMAEVRTHFLAATEAANSSKWQLAIQRYDAAVAADPTLPPKIQVKGSCGHQPVGVE